MYGSKSVIFNNDISSSSSADDETTSEIANFEKTMFICKSDTQLVAHNILLLLHKSYKNRVVYSLQHKKWFVLNEQNQWNVEENTNPIINTCRTTLLQQYLRLIKHYTYEITYNTDELDQLTINDYTNKINQCCAISVELINENSDLVKYISSMSFDIFTNNDLVKQFNNINTSVLCFENIAYNYTKKTLTKYDESVRCLFHLPYQLILNTQYLLPSSFKSDHTITDTPDTLDTPDTDTPDTTDTHNTPDTTDTPDTHDTTDKSFMKMCKQFIENDDELKNIYMFNIDTQMLSDNKTTIDQLNEYIFMWLRTMFGNYVDRMQCSIIRKIDYDFSNNLMSKLTLFTYDGVDTHYNHEIVNKLIETTGTIPLIICTSRMKWINQTKELQFNDIHIDMKRLTGFHHEDEETQKEEERIKQETLIWSQQIMSNIVQCDMSSNN